MKIADVEAKIQKSDMACTGCKPAGCEICPPERKIPSSELLWIFDRHMQFS